ncbi:LAQU0S05e05006g1_1 [Lachancea quebecensis]|uniref:LAQU0S05e05006g1_1 n=1 Tax=Lachancea quebecensis TaxID=1654605 RepID=A0A0P1KRP8_9SACH|nr:LAQU0S05e05006g1_1 [Lachancea quebecensis]
MITSHPLPEKHGRDQPSERDTLDDGAGIARDLREKLRLGEPETKRLAGWGYGLANFPRLHGRCGSRFETRDRERRGHGPGGCEGRHRRGLHHAMTHDVYHHRRCNAALPAHGFMEGFSRHGPHHAAPFEPPLGPRHHEPHFDNVRNPNFGHFATGPGDPRDPPPQYSRHHGHRRHHYHHQGLPHFEREGHSAPDAMHFHGSRFDHTPMH